MALHGDQDVIAAGRQPLSQASDGERIDVGDARIVEPRTEMVRVARLHEPDDTMPPCP